MRLSPQANWTKYFLRRDGWQSDGLAEKTDSGAWLRTLDSVLDEGKARDRSGLRAERPVGP